MSLSFIKAHPYRVLSVFLVLFAAVALFLVGNLGFIGDDWRSLTPAYLADWPQSLFVFLPDGKRIFQSLHVFGAFEVFALHAPIYTAMSLFWHVMGCLTMGQSLKIAFPRSQLFASVTTVFVFFMPPLTALLFRLTYDGGRISVVMFWAATICYLRWVQKPRWGFFIAGTLLWGAALMTYENILFGAGVIVLMCLPLLLTSGLPWQIQARRLIGVMVGGVGGYGLMLLVRSLAAIPFHSQPTSIVVYNLASSLTMGLRLIVPPMPTNPPLVFVSLGVVFALCIGAVWLLSRQTEKAALRWPMFLYWLIVGLAIFVVGFLPYMVADFRITSLSLQDSMIRSLSFSAYGTAIMAAALVTAIMMLRPALNVMAVFAMGIWITLSALSWFQLGEGERRDELTRQSVYQQWFGLIPDVTPETTVVLVDFPTEGFRDGIRRDGVLFRQAVKILYDDPTANIISVFTAPDGTEISQDPHLVPVIRPEGIQPVTSTNVIPLDHLVILQYKEGHFSIRDRFTPEDRLQAIWEGEDELVTNQSRIITTNGNLERLYQIGFLEVPAGH